MDPEKKRKNIDWSKVYSVCPGCKNRHQEGTTFCHTCIWEGKRKWIKKDWTGIPHKCPKCSQIHEERSRNCAKCLIYKRSYVKGTKEYKRRVACIREESINQSQQPSTKAS